MTTTSISARNTSAAKAAFVAARNIIMTRGYYAQVVPSTQRIVYLNKNDPNFVCVDAHDMIHLFCKEIVPALTTIERGISPLAQMKLPLYAHDHLGRIQKVESFSISAIATPDEALDYADVVPQYTLKHGQDVFKALTGKEALKYETAVPVSTEQYLKAFKKVGKKHSLSEDHFARIVSDLVSQQLIVLQ
jgi:hypothetical protein